MVDVGDSGLPRGLLLVGIGFFVFCADVLASTTTTYGGLARTLGIPYLRGRDDSPPPPQAIAATVVSIDGLLASAVGATIILALLGRSYDTGVKLDPLWAKNLTFFFGHETANLIMYLAAGAVYVILPRYAGRPWKTTKPIVVAWMATLVLLVSAYSHHLYMDFVQPEWAGSSPRLVVRSSAARRGRHHLHGHDARLGLALPLDAGLDLPLPRLRRLGDRRHRSDDRLGDPVELPLPQHRLGRRPFPHVPAAHRVFWAFAFFAHLLEREAGRTAPRGATAAAAGAMVLGGYGLTGTWFVAGALGIPRRYAVQPQARPGTASPAAFSR